MEIKTGGLDVIDLRSKRTKKAQEDMKERFKSNDLDSTLILVNKKTNQKDSEILQELFKRYREETVVNTVVIYTDEDVSIANLPQDNLNKLIFKSDSEILKTYNREDLDKLYIELYGKEPEVKIRTKPLVLEQIRKGLARMYGLPGIME